MEADLPPPPEGYEKRVPPQKEAETLVAVGRDVSDREVRLAPGAADAWQAMLASAGNEGLRLLLVSGFRSVRRQRELLRQKIAAGEAWSEILTVTAYPGHSEHHTGCAIDICAPGFEHLDAKFENTPEFSWLVANGHRFGFHLSYPRGNAAGITYEPWHWCWKA